MWSRGNGKQASSTAGVSPFFPRVAGEFGLFGFLTYYKWDPWWQGGERGVHVTSLVSWLSPGPWFPPLFSGRA